MRQRPGNIIAGCVALSAFAVAIVAGLSARNPATTVLFRALLVMAVAYPAGLVIGHIAIRVVLAPQNTREDGESESENVEGEIGHDAETGAAPAADPADDDREAVAI